MCGILGVLGAWEVEVGGFLEVFATVIAVAHARAVPAVDEDPVHPVAGHDLLLYFGHELKIVRAEAARYPHFGRGPVPAWLPVGGHCNPIRVCLSHVVIGRVGVCARNHDHPELAAARDQLAEDVSLTQPRAPMLE